MGYHQFGSTDLQLSEIGFGAMRLSGDAVHVPHPTPLSATEVEEQTESGRRALLAALEGGVNCIQARTAGPGGCSARFLLAIPIATRSTTSSR